MTKEEFLRRRELLRGEGFMTIDELMHKLQKIKNKHGDQFVYIDRDDLYELFKHCYFYPSIDGVVLR